jgi:hypothetical protein
MLFKTKNYFKNIRKLSFNSNNNNIIKNHLIRNNFLEIGEEIRDSNQPIVALESNITYSLK